MKEEVLKIVNEVMGEWCKEIRERFPEMQPSQWRTFEILRIIRERIEKL